MLHCKNHGSDFCYVQSDGTHVSELNCRCFFRPSTTCPVEDHKEKAQEWARLERDQAAELTPALHVAQAQAA